MISQGRFEEYRKKISSSLKKGHKDGRLKPAFAGKKHSQETLDKLKGHKRQVGELNSQYNTCWVTHTELGNKKIKRNDLDKYLNLGYTKGRILKNKGVPNGKTSE